MGDTSIERRGSTDSHSKKDKKKKHHKDSKDKSSKKKVNTCFMFHVSCLHMFIFTHVFMIPRLFLEQVVNWFIGWINGLVGLLSVRYSEVLEFLGITQNRISGHSSTHDTVRSIDVPGDREGTVLLSQLMGIQYRGCMTVWNHERGVLLNTFSAEIRLYPTRTLGCKPEQMIKRTSGMARARPQCF